MRDKSLLELRPILNLPDTAADSIEAFQNKTLRPVLKMQNEVTLQLLNNAAHFQKLKAKVDVSDEKAYAEVVHKYVTSNVVFRSTLIGMLIGVLTESELDFYIPNAAELNKRIVSMQIQRFADASPQAATI